MLVAYLLLTAAVGLQLDHTPVDCMIEDRFPQIEANIAPADSVAKARVYFKSSQDDDYYAVDMALRRGHFVAKLPKPSRKAGPVVYYLDVLAADGGTKRTPEMSSEVVRDARSCKDGRVAPQASEGDVRIYSMTGSTSKPRGFDGISGVGKATRGAERPAEGKPRSAEAQTPRTAEGERPHSTEAAKPRGMEREKGSKEKPGEEAKPSRAPAPAEEAPPLSSEQAAALSFISEQDYPIGPDDILKITVYGSDDLTQTVVVQADGTFNYPLVGRIKAEDLTPKELERKITALLASGFVRNPQLSVVIQEYHSHVVYVAGEVAKPGVYPLVGSRSLVEIIAKAGPMTQNARAEALVVRPLARSQGPIVLQGSDPNVPREQAQVIKVNILDIQSGKLEKNVLLKPNDTVFVPAAEKVYVTGQVRNPGAYPIVPGMTVRQAIGLAGGLTDQASEGRIRVIREVAGKARELKVKLDDRVEPKDNIVVKEKLF